MKSNGNCLKRTCHLVFILLFLIAPWSQISAVYGHDLEAVNRTFVDCEKVNISSPTTVLNSTTLLEGNIFMMFERITDSIPVPTSGQIRKQRNMGKETGLVKQGEKPLDRIDNGGEGALLENRILDLLERNSPKKLTSLPIPPDFTGFKIEIMVSKTPVLASEIKIDMSEGIWTEQNQPGETSYLVGTFNQIEEAEAYFYEKISASYNNAKIIEFISGSRL